jgi:3-oxoacyl-[acyl-carrier protein] reductase
MFTSLQGRSVLVTGGSKGIGKGIAQVFCDAGANVMIAARNEDSAKATATELQCQYVLGDVSDWEDVQRMMKVTVDAYGSLDVVCANAGYFPQTSIADMDPTEWDAVMAVNAKGSFLAVKAAMPYFAQQPKGGRIILTSSITGPFTGFPGWSHYGASKAAQLGFLRTAAIELSSTKYHRSTINAVLPGNILTEGLADLGQDYLDGMAKSIPLQRLGSVQDIGKTVLFLATDEAAYITGQTITVDGGQLLPESLEALEGL